MTISINHVTDTITPTSGALTIDGRSAKRVVSTAFASTTLTINADTTDIAVAEYAGAAGTITLAAPSGALADGQQIILRLQTTNAQTISWNAVFTGSTDLTLPTTTSGSSKWDYLGFIYNSSASKWQVIAKNFGF